MQIQIHNTTTGDRWNVPEQLEELALSLGIKARKFNLSLHFVIDGNGSSRWQLNEAVNYEPDNEYTLDPATYTVLTTPQPEAKQGFERFDFRLLPSIIGDPNNDQWQDWIRGILSEAETFYEAQFNSQLQGLCLDKAEVVKVLREYDQFLHSMFTLNWGLYTMHKDKAAKGFSEAYDIARMRLKDIASLLHLSLEEVKG